MTVDDAQFLESFQHFCDAIRLAIDALGQRIERLEDAFLKEHPMTVLPGLDRSEFDDLVMRIEAYEE